MLTLNDVHVFLAAAEAQSFSGAARKLFLTQPAVSQQIQALERRLKVELFERKGGRIFLTADGRALVPLAREMTELAVQIEENMAARRGVVAGKLRIGCTTTPGKYVLPRLVGSFCSRYPEVKISVEVIGRSRLAPLLQRQEINFGIMSGQTGIDDLVYDELMDDELVLIVPVGHPFSGCSAVPLDRLRGETIILREEHSGTRITLIEGLERAGLRMDELRIAPVEFGAAEAVIAAVESGCGISWVSRIVAARASDTGKINIVDVDGVRLHRMVYLVSQRARIETNAHHKFYEYVLSAEGRAAVIGKG